MTMTMTMTRVEKAIAVLKDCEAHDYVDAGFAIVDALNYLEMAVDEPVVLKGTLKDGNGDTKTLNFDAKIVWDHHVAFTFDGYGDKVSDEGGCPLIVEFYNGELRVVVWGDINQEDYTYIVGLNGAKESNREQD